MPEWIRNFHLEIDINKESFFLYEDKKIYLKDNPIQSPPMYLIQRGKESIQKYFQKGEPYLDSIAIQNYFSLEDIKLNNLSDKKEIYFLGENGDGKTILLQAIALALKGNQNFGVINDVFKDNDSLLQEWQNNLAAPKHAKELDKRKLKVILKSIDSFGYTKTFQEENTSLPHSNVYGYGINRIFSGQENIREDEKEEVYLSLFEHKYNLVDPVQWLKDIRMEELENKEKEIDPPAITVKLAKSLLSELLNKEIDIIVNSKGVTFSEKGSPPINFRQLSDGYKSIMNWLCDLLSRLSKRQPYVTQLENYYGIVLVDEIGVYLHPRLQYSIVPMLRNKFKNIQWIFTTHNPIVTLGASPDSVLYRIYKENGKSKISEPIIGLSGMTANSLVTSLLWRLDSFSTKGTDFEDINSDDYVYKVIHETVKENIKKKVNSSE